MLGLSWNFQDRSNIAQGTTWGIVFWGIRVYCMCVCVQVCVFYVCAAAGVGGVGVLIDCFVSGYTNFIHFLFCFCSNQRTCYNHSCSQQYFTCIMQGKVNKILSLCSIFLINWWTQLHNTPWSEYVTMESITFWRSLSIYMNQLF